MSFGESWLGMGAAWQGVWWRLGARGTARGAIDLPLPEAPDPGLCPQGHPPEASAPTQMVTHVGGSPTVALGGSLLTSAGTVFPSVWGLGPIVLMSDPGRGGDIQHPSRNHSQPLLHTHSVLCHLRGRTVTENLGWGGEGCLFRNRKVQGRGGWRQVRSWLGLGEDFGQAATFEGAPCLLPPLPCGVVVGGALWT